MFSTLHGALKKKRKTSRVGPYLALAVPELRHVFAFGCFAACDKNGKRMFWQTFRELVLIGLTLGRFKNIVEKSESTKVSISVNISKK